VEVGIDGTIKAVAQRLRGAQTQLEAGNEVEVDSIEVVNHGAQLGPGPAGDSTGHPLTAPLGRLIVKHNPVIGRGDFHTARPGSQPRQSAEELLGLRAQVPSDLDERDDLPIRWEAGIKAGEGIRNASPLLYRWRERVPAVNEVPDERADDPDSRHGYP
jgi:hypothetical protein